MIIGFAGTPGSGKTYEAVKKIVDNLQLGRVVFTNIRGIDAPTCREMIKCRCGLSDLALTIQLNMLSDDQTKEFWLHIAPGALVVLDEVQNFFGCRNYKSIENQTFGAWASTHRHNGFDVVLITQAIERIDSAVRALLEWTYVFRKVNYFGSMIKNQYMCYSYGGEETNGKPLSSEKRSYDKGIFACYQSYVAADIKEMGIMKHVNVLKHPVFFIIPLMICFALYMVFFKSSIGSGDLFGTKEMMDKAGKKQVISAKTSTAPQETLSGTIKSSIKNGVTVYEYQSKEVNK